MRVLHFTLQHVLRQQVPSNESGELAVPRLRNRGREAFAGLRAVVFVHGTPLRNIAVKNSRQRNRKPARFLAKPITPQRNPIKKVRVDPDRPAPIGVGLDNRLVAVRCIVISPGCEIRTPTASRRR